MLRVRHREYINPVDWDNSHIERPGVLGVGHTAHKPLRYSLNPGDGTTFPWLSGLATRFEKYQFTKITVTYKPTCATTTQGGIALLAVYDPADEVPDTRSQLFTAESSVRAAIYDEVKLIIKQSHLKRKLYVRMTHHKLVDANELRLSDVGFFLGAVTNTIEKYQFGDLYIDYDVTFYGPKVSNYASKCAVLTFQGGGETKSSAGGTRDPFAITPYNGLTLALLELDSSTYLDPASTLKIDLEHDGRIGHIANNRGGFPKSTDCTRLVFREPFNGFMHVHVDPQGGGIDQSIDVDFNHAIVPAADLSSRATVTPVGNVVHDGSTDHSQKSYTIRANAGEVIDVIGRNVVGALHWSGKIALAFAEAAPALLESASILGLAA